MRRILAFLLIFLVTASTDLAILPTVVHAQQNPWNVVTSLPSTCIPPSPGIAGSEPLMMTANGQATLNYCTGLNTWSSSACNTNGGLWVGSPCYSTVQSAINALPQGSTGGGVVYIPCGTYVGPTTIPSGTALIGMCAGWSIGVTEAHVTFTYTSTLTLADEEDIRMDNITMDFGQTGSGLVLEDVSDSQFTFLSLSQCGSTTVECLKLLSDTSSTLRTVSNTFDHLQIYGNSATGGGTPGPAKVGILLLGSGAVNNGPQTTQNKFYDTFIRGAFVGGIDEELNADTNYFYSIEELQEAAVNPPTNSYALAFNLLTPGSDQDADAGMFYAVNYTSTAAPTSYIRSGQASGNFLQFTTTTNGLPSITVTGGNPTFTIQTLPLNGALSEFAIWGGRLSVGNGATFGSAANSVAGDMTAARSSTLGVLFLGTDGGNISRNGSYIGLVCASGTAGCAINSPEIAAPAGVAGQDVMYPDSTAHKWKTNNNNGGAVTFGYIDLAETYTADKVFNTTSTGLLLPKLAAAAPTVDGNIANDTGDHMTYYGSNGTTQRVSKTCSLIADHSGSSSATLGTITWAASCTFPVKASTNYQFECDVLSTSTNAAGGLFMGITGPSTPTASNYALSQALTATTTGYHNISQTTTYSTTGAGVVAQTITTTWPAHFAGTFENASNAGTLSFQFANGSATGSTVLKRGSFCTVH